MGSWYLIEALRPPAFSVVFRNGESRDWTSIRSLRRQDGVEPIEDLCNEVLHSRERIDRVIVGRLGARRIVMVPVLGAEGDVYAIKTWIGESSEQPTPERAVAAVAWEIETLTVTHTLESYMMSSISPEGFGSTRDPGEFLRKVVQFDALNELAELCMNDGTRTQFQGALTVLHDDGHLMAWRGISRAGTGPGGAEIRGLMHDVSDTEKPSIGPLTALRLSDLERRTDAPPAVLIAYKPNTGGNPAVIPAIMYWISPKPSYVAESAVANYPADMETPGTPPNLIHPDDWPEFARAQKVLEARTQNELEIPVIARILNRDSKWTTVRFLLTSYPGAVGERLHVGRFSPIETEHIATT